MRILYITLENISIHKGSVIHIKEVVDNLRKRGHLIGLIAFSENIKGKHKQFYNLKVIPNSILKIFRLTKQPYIISSLFLFFYLLKIISNYDIIYAREYHAVIIAFLPRLFFKKKLIFEINGLASEEQKLKGLSLKNQFFSFFIQIFEKMATKLSDKIISVTPQIRTYLIKNYKCKEVKIEVIGNGVNTNKFFPIFDKNLIEQWRAKLGIKSKESIVIFVGNLARWQGVDILLESGFQLLKKRNNLKFLIVGDGVLKDYLMMKLSISDLKDKFIFTGMVNYDDIPYFINIADVCVAPFIQKRNWSTGVSPLKVYEYMACGKPVVTTRINGLEFIEKNGIGKLVTPGNATSLAEALDDLFDNREKMKKMGQIGSKIANEQFNWDLRVKYIEKTLKEII